MMDTPSLDTLLATHLTTTRWSEGTPKAWRGLLGAMLGYGRRRWPRSDQAFRQALQAAAPALLARGIRVTMTGDRIRVSRRR